MPDDAIQPTPKAKAKPKADKPKPDDRQKPAADKPAADKPAADKPKLDIAALFKAGSYTDVVTACTSAPSLVAANAASCTVAACKAKQPAKAKRWFSQVGAAKKRAVVEDCDGVLVADKPADKPAAADDVCKRDPMACQH